MLHFIKGHGTENDFVVLPDPEGRLELTPALVRALCDRRGGIGGDGVLRVVRAERVPDAESISGPISGAEWYMDYRNADGSTAEMCGNGIRVYARYLIEAGLASSGELLLATRSGVKRVHASATGEVSVEMGPATVLGPATAVIAGRGYVGVHVDVGNPHLVCVVADDLEAVDLTVPPAVDRSVFPDGVNVEIVASRGEGHIAMRVHERGVGETRSCGTGACAAAVAVFEHSAQAEPMWLVDVLGGQLTVELGESVLLRGPAVLVAKGVVDADWFAVAKA